MGELIYRAAKGLFWCSVSKMWSKVPCQCCKYRDWR